MLGVAAIGVSACSGSDTPSPVTPPPAPVDPNVVGATGGTVTAENGAVTLQVPAGAVSASTRIAVTPRTDMSANPNVGAAWEFGPSGTQFAAPVTMRLRFPANAFAADVDLSRLTLARLENGAWVPRAEQVSVDPATREVRGQVRSFSTWGVVSDPCAPGVVSFGAAFTGAGTLNTFSCLFASGSVSRWSRYWEFEVTSQSTFEWRVRPEFAHVVGIKQATTNTSEGTVWGSVAGNAGDSTVLRAVLAPARYQLFVSTRDTSARGAFTFAGGTPSVPALTNGLGCSRATWLVPGTRVAGAVLDSAAGDCRSTIQFTPFPEALGKPLVIDFYQARLLAGRTYTITYTLPSRAAYGGAALTVYRGGVVGQDIQDQSRLVRTLQITPPSDGTYVIEASAAGSSENNWALPAPFAYEVAVSDGGAPVAATVELAPSTMRLGAVGDTANFAVTVRRNGAVVGGAVPAWRSSDLAVATVSSAGVITAMGRGSATITATWGTGEATASVSVDPSAYVAGFMGVVRSSRGSSEVTVPLAGVDTAIHRRNLARADSLLAVAERVFAQLPDSEKSAAARALVRLGVPVPGFSSTAAASSVASPRFVAPAACLDRTNGGCEPVPNGCWSPELTRRQVRDCHLALRELRRKNDADWARRSTNFVDPALPEDTRTFMGAIYDYIRWLAIKERPAPAGQLPAVQRELRRSTAIGVRGLMAPQSAGAWVAQANETPLVLNSGIAQPLGLAIAASNPLPSDAAVPVAVELLGEYARVDTLWRTLATESKVAFEPEVPRPPTGQLNSVVTGALLSEVRIAGVSRPGVVATLVDLGNDIGLRLTGPSSAGAVFTVTLETTNAEFGIVRRDVPVVLRAGTPQIESASVSGWAAIGQDPFCNGAFPQGTNGRARIRVRLSEPVPPGRGLHDRAFFVGGSTPFGFVPVTAMRQVGDREYEHEAGFCWGGPAGFIDYELQFEDTDGTRSNVFRFRVPRP
ncbi:hypothetical protein GEMMAAP_19405 [Gemmatimonas phototrophica]|uniref:BIG2 domain-containing protein n=2 Tax=Gemmatimonas phototrophica TaxID=1379270 RepID=A0A143BMS4_9BACT|nr:hypothetical protein GEMMAAP_19405 [Gemmatimonas phototrophica]